MFLMPGCAPGFTKQYLPEIFTWSDLAKWPWMCLLFGREPHRHVMTATENRTYCFPHSPYRHQLLSVLLRRLVWNPSPSFYCVALTLARTSSFLTQALLWLCLVFLIPCSLLTIHSLPNHCCEWPFKNIKQIISSCSLNLPTFPITL